MNRALRCRLAAVLFVGYALAPTTASADGPLPALTPGDGVGGPSSLAAPTPQADSPAALATVDLATGESKASFAFALPTARGQAQPTLGLVYSSGNGVGFAGIGWTLDLPAIERRGASGAPRFDVDVLGTGDDATFADRYVFGSSPLVPICQVAEGGRCTVAGANRLQDGEQVPASLAGWFYFRTEIDDGMRFFFAPSGLTWVVQTKQGVTLTFGDDDRVSGTSAIERGHEPLAPAPLVRPYPVFRWNLATQRDTSGNRVYYTWQHLQTSPAAGVDGIFDEGREYLTDIYDTRPASAGNGGIRAGDRAVAASFAHHVHLTWNSSGGLRHLLAQSPSWRTPPALFHVRSS